MDGLEMQNLLFNVRYLCLRPFANVGLCRMRVDAQGKQILNLFQRKAQLLGPLDETNPPHRFGGKDAITGFCTRRGREKSLTLVVSNRLNVDASTLRHLADAQAVHESTVNPVLRYRVKREMRKLQNVYSVGSGLSGGRR